ncbi:MULTISPECIES: hypothetical protein [Anaerobutyricum]|nr:hypothetical protein [Anaerobutyricum hallii]
MAEAKSNIHVEEFEDSLPLTFYISSLLPSKSFQLIFELPTSRTQENK